MDAMHFISLLGLGISIVAGGLYLLPVGTCQHCDHCRRERERKAEERHIRDHEGGIDCRDKGCGRNRRP
jgi:hypothetical protein